MLIHNKQKQQNKKNQQIVALVALFMSLFLFISLQGEANSLSQKSIQSVKSEWKNRAEQEVFQSIKKLAQVLLPAQKAAKSGFINALTGLFSKEQLDPDAYAKTLMAQAKLVGAFWCTNQSCSIDIGAKDIRAQSDWKHKRTRLGALEVSDRDYYNSIDQSRIFNAETITVQIAQAMNVRPESIKLVLKSDPQGAVITPVGLGNNKYLQIVLDLNLIDDSGIACTIAHELSHAVLGHLNLLFKIQEWEKQQKATLKSSLNQEKITELFNAIYRAIESQADIFGSIEACATGSCILYFHHKLCSGNYCGKKHPLTKDSHQLVCLLQKHIEAAQT